MARLVDNPDLAFRLARAIASDIALYNQEKVANGLKNDDLFESMKDELAEGRDHFMSRIDPSVTNRENLFEKAIVDVLIKQAKDVETAIW